MNATKILSATDADTSHEDAHGMYTAYGWTITTAAGDVDLQTVSFDEAACDTDTIIHRLQSDGIVGRSAAALAAMARGVRADMEAIEEALEEAVSAHAARDLAACVDALDRAQRLEREHGASPATDDLRSRLLRDDEDA